MMRRSIYIVLSVTAILSSCCPAIAQNRDKYILHEESWRYVKTDQINEERSGNKLIAISTNLMSWINLGTASLEAEYAVNRHVTLLCGARYNPWTFSYGTDREFRERCIRPYAGMRYWPFTHYTGWFAGANLQGSLHSYANMLNSNCHDGWFAGVGLQAGYAILVSRQWNINIGAGCAAGYYSHRMFDGPRCGRVLGTKEGVTLQPSELLVQLSYIF